MINSMHTAQTSEVRISNEWLTVTSRSRRIKKHDELVGAVTEFIWITHLNRKYIFIYMCVFCIQSLHLIYKKKDKKEIVL